MRLFGWNTEPGMKNKYCKFYLKIYQIYKGMEI